MITAIKEIKRTNILLLCGLLFIALCVCMLSSLNPLSKDIPGIDSSVFLTIARGIVSGKLAYVDFFDHKGPFLYFIDALGLLVGRGSYTGVWLMELLFMFVSVFFAYKTARFFGGKLCAFLGIGFSFITLAPFFEKGNMVEEYVLPFIFISLYIFTKYYFTQAQLSKIKLSILGACFGVSLLLRPNMFALWAAFCLVIFFQKLWKKDYKLLGQYILFFLAGTLLLLLSFGLYLKMTGSFDECINQFIVFNRIYTLSPERAPLTVFFFAKSFLWVLKEGALLPVLIAIVWLLKKPHDTKYVFYVAYALFLFFSLLLMALTRCPYVHYCMIFIPLLVPALTFCTEKLFLLFRSSKQYVVKYGAPILLLCIFFNSPIAIGLLDINNHLKSGEKEYFVNLGKFIDANTTPDDVISVLSNQCAVYLYTERNSASKYIYQLPPAQVSRAIGMEYSADIQKVKPALLIVPLGKDSFGDIEEIKKLLFPVWNDYYECFNSGRHVIFKRK
jgi:hypothetical protein